MYEKSNDWDSSFNCQAYSLSFICSLSSVKVRRVNQNTCYHDAIMISVKFLKTSEMCSSHLWIEKSRIPPVVLQEQRKDESIWAVYSFNCFCGEQFIIFYLQYCHLPGDLMNRIYNSVGIGELASDSDLLEGHISSFTPNLKIRNVNSVGNSKQFWSS